LIKTRIVDIAGPYNVERNFSVYELSITSISTMRKKEGNLMLQVHKFCGLAMSKTAQFCVDANTPCPLPSILSHLIKENRHSITIMRQI